MARSFASTDRVTVPAATSINNLAQGGAFAVGAIVRRTADGANQYIACKQVGATGWIFMFDESTGNGTFGCLRGLVFRATTIADYHAAPAAALPTGTWFFVGMSYDGGAAATVRLYVGTLAGEISEITVFSTAANGSGTPVADASNDLILGNASSGATPLSGDLYRVGVWNTARTLAQFRAWRDAMVRASALKAEYTLGAGSPEPDSSGTGNSGTVTGTSAVTNPESPVTITTSDVAHSLAYGTRTPSGGEGTYVFTSAFAEVGFDVNADTVDIAAYTSLDNTDVRFDGQRKIGVLVDGAYIGDLDLTRQNDFQRGTVALPGSGTRRVTLINGGGSRPAAVDPWEGSFAHTVRFSASGAAVSASAATPSTASPLVHIVQDSIYGFNADPGAQLAWVQRFRATYRTTRRVLTDVYGGRALWHDGASAGARTTFASALAATGARTYVISLGANDKGRNYWSAADYQTAMADFLAKLSAATGTARIYVVQPFIQDAAGESGTNSFGNTLSQYRTAVVNAASGIARVTVLDGRNAVTSADLAADGVHFTNTGHGLISTYFEGQVAVDAAGDYDLTIILHRRNPGGPVRAIDRAAPRLPVSRPPMRRR